jgi:hypothetical protein
MLAVVVVERSDEIVGLLRPRELPTATRVEEVGIALGEAHKQLSTVGSELQFEQRSIDPKLLRRVVEGASDRRERGRLSIARKEAKLNQIEEGKRHRLPLAIDMD